MNNFKLQNIGLVYPFFKSVHTLFVMIPMAKNLFNISERLILPITNWEDFFFNLIIKEREK